MAQYELITEGILEDISNAIRIKRGIMEGISVEDMPHEIELIDGRLDGEIEKSTNTKLRLISSAILTAIGDAIRKQLKNTAEIAPGEMAEWILAIGDDTRIAFSLFDQEDLHVINKDQADGKYEYAWFKPDEKEDGYFGEQGANITTSWDVPIPAGYKYLILDVESGGKDGAYNMSTVYLRTEPGVTGYYGGQFNGKNLKAVSLVNFNSTPEGINSQPGVIIDSEDECYLDRQKVIIDISDIDEDFYVSWHRCDNWTDIYSIEAVNELPTDDAGDEEDDMRRHNFEMVRGDTLTFDLKMSSILTSSVTRLIMTVKKKAKDPEPLFTKGYGDGVTIIDEHTFRVRIAPEDTEALRAGTYVYDIEMTFATEVYTPLMGNIVLVQDVTTRG